MHLNNNAMPFCQRPLLSWCPLRSQHPGPCSGTWDGPVAVSPMASLLVVISLSLYGLSYVSYQEMLVREMRGAGACVGGWTGRRTPCSVVQPPTTHHPPSSTTTQRAPALRTTESHTALHPPRTRCFPHAPSNLPSSIHVSISALSVCLRTPFHRAAPGGEGGQGSGRGRRCGCGSHPGCRGAPDMVGHDGRTEVTAHVQNRAQPGPDPSCSRGVTRQ